MNLSFDRNVIRSDLLEEQGALKDAKLVPVDPRWVKTWTIMANRRERFLGSEGRGSNHNQSSISPQRR